MTDKTAKIAAADDALRAFVPAELLRHAAATVFVALAVLVDVNGQFREGPAVRLKPGARVLAVDTAVRTFADGVGEDVDPAAVWDVLTGSGLVAEERDGEDVVYTLALPW
jgi:hypothetical protein